MIDRELDELEREDFTRLKMVKKKKEEQIKQNELDKAEALRQLAESGDVDVSIKSIKIEEPQKEVTSLLSGFDATDDSDVFFK